MAFPNELLETSRRSDNQENVDLSVLKLVSKKTGNGNSSIME